MGQFVDHRDQAHCLKLCVCLCLYVFLHSASAVRANASLSQIWWLRCQPMHLLGKLGGKVWKLESVQTSTLGLMLQFQNYVFTLQPQFSLKKGLDYLSQKLFSPRSHVRILLGVIKHSIVSTFVL